MVIEILKLAVALAIAILIDGVVLALWEIIKKGAKVITVEHKKKADVIYSKDGDQC